MRTQASRGKIRQTYEFIKANRKRFDVRTMCRGAGGGSERLLRLASGAGL
jgi:hypothetical protein